MAGQVQTYFRKFKLLNLSFPVKKGITEILWRKDLRYAKGKTIVAQGKPKNANNKHMESIETSQMIVAINLFFTTGLVVICKVISQKKHFAFS